MKYIRNDFKKKKKQSHKSLYAAIFAALACVTVVGASYYKIASDRKDALQFSENAIEGAVATSAPKNGSSTGSDGDKLSEQASSIINSGAAEKKDSSAGKKTKKKIEVKANKKASDKKETSSKAVMSSAISHSFDAEKGLTWPVKGDVLMKFSQNNTIYFKTLAQYKSNPAIEISADEGTKVIASAAGTVKDVTQDDVTGTMVVTDIGNGYTVTYGQLGDIKVKKGDEVKEGQLLGLVAKPTKYFSEEGSNLYFQVKQDGKAVDPLLLLN